MSSQKPYNTLLNVVLTLALLVLVMTPPLRISRNGSGLTCRSLAKGTASISGIYSPVFRSALVISRATPIKAIRSETEEEEGFSELSSPASFSPLVSPVRPSLSSASNPADSGPRIANRPLRC